MPEDASRGLTPHRAAKEASLRSRSGLSSAAWRIDRRCGARGLSDHGGHRHGHDQQPTEGGEQQPADGGEQQAADGGEQQPTAASLRAGQNWTLRWRRRQAGRVYRRRRGSVRFTRRA
ncbi:MAG TPA: hypothetical protein VE196_12990 [Pseudonocardiaceae bacterium]|nr:hypothetical protein [Pseudonocardiaceae bacterium]